MIYYIGQQTLVESAVWKSCSLKFMFEHFKDHKYVNLDTETEGKDPHCKDIILVQFGDYSNQFVIDCRYTNIWELKEFIENNTFRAHNGKFEYSFLKAAGIHLESIYDTMLAECVIYCGYEKFGYSLADLTKRYLDIDLDKSTRGDFYKLEDRYLTDKQIEYAALDVKYLGLIHEKQQESIKKYNLQYCIDLENQVLKALGDIEFNGVTFNSEKWLQNALQADKQLFDLQTSLDTIVTQDPVISKIYKRTGVLNLFDYQERQLSINYASSVQMKKIFTELGYPSDSTDDRTLTKLVPKHEFFKKLQEYRKTAKTVNTYGKSFLKYINKSTQKVHTSYWQIVSTGRLASGSKTDNAPNLQNIPKDNIFRNCFEARPGYTWISGDYSGQELRIMADASTEEGFIKVLNSGEDLHCYAGSMMFKKPVTKEDKELRHKAKTINFAKPYGAGPPKLADMLSITIEESEKLFKDYAEAFPTLNTWLKAQGNKAKKNMYSSTLSPCNRVRWYPKMKEIKELREKIKNKELDPIKETWKKILSTEGETERFGANHVIQGTAANITKEALIQIRNLIQQYNTKYNKQVAYFIGTIHDSIEVEVLDELAKEFAEKMKTLMITIGNKYVKKVQMEVDLSLTKFWTK